MSIRRHSITTAIVLALAASSVAMTWGRRPNPPLARTHPSGSRTRRLSRNFVGRPFGLHVTSTGAILVTEQDVNLVRQLNSRSNVGSFEVGEDPGDVVATRDGEVAYVSGFQDGSITIVSLAGDTSSDLVRLPTRSAYRLALSPNERKLYVTSTDGRLYVFNTSTRTLATSKSLGGSLQGLAIDHAGARLFVTSTAGDVWRLERGTLRSLRQTTLDCAAQDIALSSDDRELYVACEKGSVKVLDSRTLEQLDILPVGPAFGLAVSPDGEQLYVSSPADGAVTIVELATRKILSRVAVQGTPRRIAFSPSGDQAYVTNEWNWLTVIE
ncbi:MAG TPA: YncE family protein [Gemmatimonadaceae bacterium]|nr:YncE family protein [Gemmatimonadaceae bacterium]